MRQPYPWLQAYLKAHLDELKGLRNTPHDIKTAVGWFNSLLTYFQSRNLSTPRQQKNYVVDVRNAIKSNFGEDHPALQVVGFDAETWTQINQPIHDRVEDRLQNTRFLTNPDAIVSRAETLLASKTSTWADLAVGLGVVIGRRLSELLGLRTKLEPKTDFSLLFTGQLKHQGQLAAFEIPTLCPASTVLSAWKRLKFMLGSEQLDPQSINQRFSRQCKEAANRHFADLVPPRSGEDDLYMHLFRAIYATLAVYYYCPPRVNGILFKAEIQGHRMIASTTDQETLRSYTASRHYDDYVIADANGNVDGRRGLRLGEPGVQVLQVLQTTPEPVSTAPTKTIPMPKPPAKTPKSAKPPARTRHWRISEAAHGTLSKDWTLDNEHQSDVLDRVLAFAGVAKKLASIMELPVGQIAPDALLAAATTRFEALSGNLKATADQMAQLKAQHDAAQRTIALLTSERDALSARLTTLQAEFQDASTRHAPPVELLPFARRVLELSSHAGSLPTAQLQESLMRLAIDAITQAEGATPAAAVAPPPTPPTQTQPPQPPLTPQQPAQPAQPTQQPQIVTAPAPTSDGPTHDGQNGQEDVNTSDAPPAEKNRNTAKAEAKLEKALEYLATLNTSATAKPDKWVVNASILASLTGCYRPAINTFIEARKQRIDELNAAHGLGPGHNRATARTHPNAIPDLVKRFKEEVLGQPF
jgi:outer membrane biosynthesis protein TonB